ncbi:unnamed protein product [Protopolystoma xenopodis]|uniref:Uncharacterized protein n=1 Tax=Protopolystoma xenopodis TaxID=117903 RepID=A0A3S5CHR2_9PLAT|nr:unnamed protein product [Protopolystoma xenopodis]
MIIFGSARRDDCRRGKILDIYCPHRKLATASPEKTVRFSAATGSEGDSENRRRAENEPIRLADADPAALRHIELCQRRCGYTRRESVTSVAE